MRLRKTLKRTAAATLALSMALSAAAPAVTAAYICDVSQGSVNITVDADGSKTIQVGGQKVEDDGDGTDDIIITGDNTQAPASQNDAAEPAPAETEDEEAPAEEDAAPADETEAPETADAEGTEDAAADDADAEDAAAEPATLELSAPAVDTGDEAEDTPAEPERTVTETEDGTVIEYGDYTVDPDVQVTKPEPAPEAAAPAEKAADPEDETVTYEAPAEENTSVVSSVVENVVKIVNNYKDALNIILRNLKVDAGTSKEDAMNISGTGDVTLELDGKNELISGSSTYDPAHGSHAGLSSRNLDGTLTLTDADKDGGSLTAKGGYSKDSGYVSSDGICAKDLSIIDTSITAVGGDVGGSSSSGGTGLSADVLNMTGSSLSATGGNVNNSTDDYTDGGTGLHAGSLSMTGSSLSATGGSVSNSTDDPTNDPTNDYSIGGIGLDIGNYSNLKSNISDSHISAIGGNSSGSGKKATGGTGAIIIGTAADSYLIDHVTLLAQGGNAQASGSGNATGGRGIDRNSGKITISDSAVTVAGGNAVSESGTATGGGGYYNNANYYSSNNDVHLVSGSLTAVGGSGSSKSGSSKNGSSFDISSELISNYYISDGETLSVYEPGDREYNIARSDRLVVSEDSGIVYYNHSAVVQNEDGSVTVTGEPFRYVRGDHVYTIASRTATTIIWHCEDEGVEDLELPIPAGSTFDAMKHEWVTSEDGTYEECTICHLQRTIPQPEPDQPDTPSNDTTAAAVPAALHLRVVDANGADVTFETRTESGNYIVDARRDGLDTATLLAPLPVLRELQASGAESITFVTNLKTTTLSLSALLALGGEDDEAQLLHTGDVPTLTVGGTVHNELL